MVRGGARKDAGKHRHINSRQERLLYPPVNFMMACADHDVCNRYRNRRLHCELAKLGSALYDIHNETSMILLKNSVFLKGKSDIFERLLNVREMISTTLVNSAVNQMFSPTFTPIDNDILKEAIDKESYEELTSKFSIKRRYDSFQAYFNTSLRENPSMVENKLRQELIKEQCSVSTHESQIIKDIVEEVLTQIELEEQFAFPLTKISDATMPGNCSTSIYSTVDTTNLDCQPKVFLERLPDQVVKTSHWNKDSGQERKIKNKLNSTNVEDTRIKKGNLEKGCQTQFTSEESEQSVLLVQLDENTYRIIEYEAIEVAEEAVAEESTDPVEDACQNYARKSFGIAKGLQQRTIRESTDTIEDAKKTTISELLTCPEGADKECNEESTGAIKHPKSKSLSGNILKLDHPYSCLTTGECFMKKVHPHNEQDTIDMHSSIEGQERALYSFLRSGNTRKSVNVSQQKTKGDNAFKIPKKVDNKRPLSVTPPKRESSGMKRKKMSLGNLFKEEGVNSETFSILKDQVEIIVNPYFKRKNEEKGANTAINPPKVKQDFTEKASKEDIDRALSKAIKTKEGQYHVALCKLCPFISLVKNKNHNRHADKHERKRDEILQLVYLDQESTREKYAIWLPIAKKNQLSSLVRR